MNENKKISVGLILGWVVGVVLFITGIANIASNILPGILLLVASVIAIPPIVKIVEEKIKHELSGGVKILAVVVLVILAGTFMVKSGTTENPQNNVPAASSPETNNAINSDQPAPAVQQTEKPQQPTQPAAVQPGKSYQQIFVFSGNGAKKSEPFTITGSRFRIRYDCSGDLCQAFLYRNGRTAGVIMNAMGPVKDETIEYGAGEYYIEANTIGTYTMIIEDYR